MSKRLKIRFPTEEAFNAAQAIETPGAEQIVSNEKRKYYSINIDELPDNISSRELVSAGVERIPTLGNIAERFGADIVEDYQYELDANASDFSFEAIEAPSQGTLSDVTDMIAAPKAWQHSTGKGATIAIVDTGIDGSHSEFPQEKRVGSWQPIGDTPWTDWEGHGTMCATIAAASDGTAGGQYRGVAPDAGLIACKTEFYDSELAAIYDFLVTKIGDFEGPIIASNSFGRKTGSPPPVPSHSDFIDALSDAIEEGIIAFFSAGNNHKKANGLPSACDPNSVWLHKSRADVFAVATCDLDQQMWFYSSRGPGQHFGDANTSSKPDVTAPTPRNGKILYGSGESVLSNGWGTSGACPQVAGLAALMVSLDSSLGRSDVFEAIRESAQSIGHGTYCEGAGMVDCGATIDKVVAGFTS